MRLVRCLLIVALIPLTAAATWPAAGDVRRTEADPLDYRRALPTADVLIDVGHGGIDGGTHYGGILEKDINLAVAKKLFLILNSRGIITALNRTGDYALSDENRWHSARSRHRKDLSQRRQLTREMQTGLLVSLHVNWSKNRSIRGPIVLHHESGESTMLAASIQGTLNQQQQSSKLPKLGRTFYLLRGEYNAVIVEMGFLSNDRDRAMLTDPVQQKAIARAIADGICHYLWLVGGSNKFRHFHKPEIGS